MADCGEQIRFPVDAGHVTLPCTQPPHDPVDPHECNGALPDGTVFHLRWLTPARTRRGRITEGISAGNNDNIIITPSTDVESTGERTTLSNPALVDGGAADV